MKVAKAIQACTNLTAEEAALVRELSERTGMKSRYIYKQAIVTWVKNQLEVLQ